VDKVLSTLGRIGLHQICADRCRGPQVLSPNYQGILSFRLSHVAKEANGPKRILLRTLNQITIAKSSHRRSYFSFSAFYLSAF
jgi:hypothetical protein